MGYRCRVFCQEEFNLSIKSLDTFLNKSYSDCKFKGHQDSCDDEHWEYTELHYQEENNHILLEVNRRGEDDELIEDEVENFIHNIGKVNLLSFKKKKLINIIKNTELIVCFQIPISDINDKGFDVIFDLANEIANKSNGIIHYDNEGYYLNGNLYLKD